MLNTQKTHQHHFLCFSVKIKCKFSLQTRLISQRQSVKIIAISFFFAYHSALIQALFHISASTALLIMSSCADMTKLKPEGIRSPVWTLIAVWGCPRTKTMAWPQEQINVIFLHRNNPFRAEPGHLKLVRKFSGSRCSRQKKDGQAQTGS